MYIDNNTFILFYNFFQKNFSKEVTDLLKAVVYILRGYKERSLLSIRIDFNKQEIYLLINYIRFADIKLAQNALTLILKNQMMKKYFDYLVKILTKHKHLLININKKIEKLSWANIKVNDFYVTISSPAKEAAAVPKLAAEM